MAENETAPASDHQGGEDHHNSSGTNHSLANVRTVVPTAATRMKMLAAAAEDVRLHEADIKVLIVLLDTIGKTGAGWWGFGKIAQRIGKHRTAVIRSVALLEQLGYVTCERAKGGSKNDTTRYRMGSSSSARATSSTHATGSIGASDQSHPRTAPVAPTHHESLKLESLELEPEKNALTSDGKAVLWKRAVEFLKSAGETEKNARSIIGKLRKNLRNDDARLLELIETAEREVSDPVPWLMQHAKPKLHAGVKVAQPFAAPTEAQSAADADLALELLGGAP